MNSFENIRQGQKRDLSLQNDYFTRNYATSIENPYSSKKIYERNDKIQSSDLYQYSPMNRNSYNLDNVRNNNNSDLVDRLKQNDVDYRNARF